MLTVRRSVQILIPPKFQIFEQGLFSRYGKVLKIIDKEKEQSCLVVTLYGEKGGGGGGGGMLLSEHSLELRT